MAKDKTFLLQVAACPVFKIRASKEEHFPLKYVVKLSWERSPTGIVEREILILLP